MKQAEIPAIRDVIQLECNFANIYICPADEKEKIKYTNDLDFTTNDVYYFSMGYAQEAPDKIGDTITFYEKEPNLKYDVDENIIILELDPKKERKIVIKGKENEVFTSPSIPENIDITFKTSQKEKIKSLFHKFMPEK